MSPTSTVGVGFGANLANDGPPDLPTQERTEDLEAWRERMDDRREEARGHRDVIQAGVTAEAAVTVRPRPAPPRVRTARVDLTTQRRAAVVTAYLAGDSTLVLAARYDVTPTTIGNWLKAAGVTLRPSGGQHRRAAVPTPVVEPEPEPVVVPLEPAVVVDEPAPAPQPAPAVDRFAGHRVNGAQVMRDRMAAAGVTAAQLRQWAQEQGRTVPSHGTPSAALLADYLAATTTPDPVDPQALAVVADPAPVPVVTSGSRYVDAAEAAAMAAAYTAGQTAVEIASAHHRNPSTIRKNLHKAGVQQLRDERSTRSGGRTKVDDPAVVDAVRRLYVGEALTQAQVGDRLGMGTHAVQKLMGRNGIESRPDVTGVTVGPRPPAPRSVRYLPAPDQVLQRARPAPEWLALAAALPDPPVLTAADWLACNPAIGRTVSEPAIAAALRSAEREGDCWTVPADAPAVVVDAVLGVPVLDVAAALQDVVTATEQLLEAQRAVALMRVRALHRLASELLAVLDHPSTTTGVRR